MLLKNCMDGVKIVFDLEQDDSGYPPYQVESLWALPVETGGYRIDNIPWYVREIACGDVVAVLPGEDDRLRFSGEILHRSGNRTMRVRLAEESIARSAAIGGHRGGRHLSLRSGCVRGLQLQPLLLLRILTLPVGG